MTNQPHLLYLITEDWYFWSHRLDLARQAAQAGFHVSIATRVTEHGDRIRKEGFRLLPLRLDRRSKNPFAELAALLELLRLYRRERPTIVHHVALKPILYGSFAAWCSRVPVVVNAFAGLGYAFTDQKRQHGVVSNCLQYIYRVLLRLSKSVVLFQNKDDRDLLIKEHVVTFEQTRIIPGSGVDTRAFDVLPSSSGSPVVLLAARMLWDKGIGDFVEAVRTLKRDKVSGRFVLVGRCDEHNPAAIAQAQLEAWIAEGVIEWWQHREDMPSVFSGAAIVVLASYREGLPKALLEAAACGKPLVATDVPGCREIVSHGINGFLVPPRDPVALARAIDALLRDSALRTKMGLAGREAVLRSFSVEKVTGQMLMLYRELLVKNNMQAAEGPT